MICTTNSCAAQLKTGTAAQLFIFVPSHITSTVSSRTPCFLSSHDKARGGKIACENNDFTPCLKTFGESPSYFQQRGEKKKKKNQRENFCAPPAACAFCMTGLCADKLCVRTEAWWEQTCEVVGTHLWAYFWHSVCIICTEGWGKSGSVSRAGGGWGGEEDAKEEKKEKKASPVEIIQRSVEFSSDYFYTGQNLTACTLGEGHARRDGEVPRLRFWQMWSLSFRLFFVFLPYLLQFVSGTAGVFPSTHLSLLSPPASTLHKYVKDA